jgi:hypothetical protein
MTTTNWGSLGEALAKQTRADRRERIAIAAMQGMLAAEPQDDEPYDNALLAQHAVSLADALIAELDKDQK